MDKGSFDGPHAFRAVGGLLGGAGLELPVRRGWVMAGGAQARQLPPGKMGLWPGTLVAGAPHPPELPQGRLGFHSEGLDDHSSALVSQDTCGLFLKPVEKPSHPF